MHILEDLEKGMVSTGAFFNTQKPFLANCKCPQILIVDDEPFNVFSMDGILGSLGLKMIDKAFNGQEALEKIRT